MHSIQQTQVTEPLSPVTTCEDCQRLQQWSSEGGVFISFCYNTRARFLFCKCPLTYPPPEGLVNLLKLLHEVPLRQRCQLQR